MRTTLTIDDDLIAAARSLAQARSESLSKTFSDLARRGLDAAPRTRRLKSTSGFPVFDVPLGAHPITLEAVRMAEDEE